MASLRLRMAFAVSARGSLFLLVTELVEGCGAAASFFTPNQLLMIYLSFYYKLFSYVILLHAVRGRRVGGRATHTIVPIMVHNSLSSATTVPTSMSIFSGRGFFPPLLGYFPLSAGNNFFSRHMIPTVAPLQKHGEEAEPEATIKFPPPPLPSDPTPSPAAIHRPESTPFVQLLHYDPIDHPPPLAPLLSDRHSRHERSIKTPSSTMVIDRHAFHLFHIPPTSYRTPSWPTSLSIC
jgi:hypothetical protein